MRIQTHYRMLQQNSGNKMNDFNAKFAIEVKLRNMQYLFLLRKVKNKVVRHTTKVADNQLTSSGNVTRQHIALSFRPKPSFFVFEFAAQIVNHFGGKP